MALNLGTSPKILITGANGFIGRHAVEFFLRNNWEVYAVVRTKKKAQSTSLDKYYEIECDLENIDTISVEHLGIDVFLHLAWNGLERENINAVDIQRANEVISLNCAKLALKIKCKVYVDGGSRAEYGNCSKAMKETMECLPITAYGKAKLSIYKQTMDLFCEKRISYYHLRIFSVYGMGDHPWSLISTLVRDLAMDKEVALGSCLHYWNFLHIDDAVSAIYLLALRGLCAHKSERETVNIASAVTRPLYEYAHAVHQCVEGRGSLLFAASSSTSGKGMSVIPDVTRLYELLPAYQEKYSFEDGIREILRNSQSILCRKGNV